MDQRYLDPTNLREVLKYEKFVNRNGEGVPFSAEVASGQRHPTAFHPAFTYLKDSLGREIMKGTSDVVIGPEGEPLLIDIVKADRHRTVSRRALIQGALVQMAENKALSDLDEIYMMIFVEEQRGNRIVDIKDAQRILKEREEQGFKRRGVSRALVERVREETRGAKPIFVGMEGKAAREKGEKLALHGFGALDAKVSAPLTFADFLDLLRPFTMHAEIGGMRVEGLFESHLARVSWEFNERPKSKAPETSRRRRKEPDR